MFTGPPPAPSLYGRMLAHELLFRELCRPILSAISSVDMEGSEGLACWPRLTAQHLSEPPPPASFRVFVSASKVKKKVGGCPRECSPRPYMKTGNFKGVLQSTNSAGTGIKGKHFKHRVRVRGTRGTKNVPCKKEEDALCQCRPQQRSCRPQFW